MIFGIWPGVVAADLVTLRPLDCPPEDPDRTLAALRTLQGGSGPFFVRAYRHFGRGVRPHAGAVASPARPELYAGQGRLVDLVACYQSPRADPQGFARFVREAVRDVAAWGGGKVQVGEELNVPAPLDGGSPGCFEAVAVGVAAALDERDRVGGHVEVGVNSAGPADPDFWRTLTAALGPDLAGRLDHLGLDAFPDVFARLAPDRLPQAVRYLVDRFRTVTADCGIPGTYEWFGLRDGLTTASWFARFGLLRDDYSPKPPSDRCGFGPSWRSSSIPSGRCVRTLAVRTLDSVVLAGGVGDHCPSREITLPAQSARAPGPPGERASVVALCARAHVHDHGACA